MMRINLLLNIIRLQSCRLKSENQNKSQGLGGPWARWMIANLVSMGFVNAATNLIITQATGAGKTYLIGYLYFET